MIECRDYRPADVEKALRRGVTLLGGMRRFAAQGENILIKPNLLVGEHPDRCVTPHPAVFRAAARLIQETGATLSFGDSPSFGSLRRAASRSGLLAVARELSIPLADFHTAVTVSYPRGLIVKQVAIAKAVLESDGVISLCKMKTHALTRITGAIKNQFGCVPGLRKPEFHVKMPNPEHFSTMLADICSFVRPRLYIMDGIMAMEGNGPRGGDPRPMNLLLLSSDPVAMDAVFSRLIGLDPGQVPFLEPAARAGLGTYQESEIEIVGATIAEFKNLDFKVNRQPSANRVQSFPAFLKNRISPRPVIDYSICSNCGICLNICPVPDKAVCRPHDDPGRQPRFVYARCIRCYCCQETCPEKAIRIKFPLLGKILYR